MVDGRGRAFAPAALTRTSSRPMTFYKSRRGAARAET
jgi:hypothetical protein